LTHRQAAARLLAERRAILTALEDAKAEFLATRDAAHASPDRPSRRPMAAAGTAPPPTAAENGAMEGRGTEPARWPPAERRGRLR
jgi:hypothetical protein